MQRAIEGTKKIITEHLVEHYDFNYCASFTEYSPCYLFTNENIKAYLKYVELNQNAKVLSVLASGDQTFNLVTNGITKIDTFDTNKLTEYFALGIKRAMILKYSYEDFVKVATSIVNKSMNILELSSFITDLLPYMEEKHRTFWSEIIDFNYREQRHLLNKDQLNLFGMLCYSSFNYTTIPNNNYLTDEESYNTLKRNLGKANITFTCCDARKLKDSFRKRYDAVLLSNIMDYIERAWKKEENYHKIFQHYKSLKNITMSDAVIFLAYIFDYEEHYFEYKKIERENKIYNAEIVSFRSNKVDDADDAMILVRKGIKR